MRAIKSVLILVIGAALALLVAQNTAPVQAHFLWYTAQMPVIVLLIATAFAGFALGLLVGVFGSSRQRRSL